MALLHIVGGAVFDAIHGEVIVDLGLFPNLRTN